MRRYLLTAAAFVVSAAIGVGVLAVLVILMLLIARHSHPVAISHWTVLIVPIAFGLAGAGYVLYHIRRQS